MERIEDQLRPSPIGADKTLDTVTGAEWRKATDRERRDFLRQEARRGFVAFACLTCGFPVAYGGARCGACQK